MSAVAGLVLAGGLARRMGGGDKALLRLGDRTLLDHLLGCLAPQIGHIAISANGDPSRFSPWGRPVLADTLADRGPLGGVLSGLEWAAGLGAESLLSVPGDTPFVPAGLRSALSPAPAFVAGHHAVALWPVACGPVLRAWLTAGHSLRVWDFLAAIEAREVRVAGDFSDVNTPGALALVREKQRKNVLF